MNTDKIFGEIISKGGIQKAPDNFTELIMNKIQTEETPVLSEYEPVIRKRTWFILAATILIIFVLSIFLSPESSSIDYKIRAADYLNSFMASVTQFIINLSSLNFILPTIVLLSTFFFANEFISLKRRMKNNFGFFMFVA